MAGQSNDDRYVRGGGGQTQSGRPVAGQPDDDRYYRVSIVTVETAGRERKVVKDRSWPKNA